jgi:hypothetical protein
MQRDRRRDPYPWTWEIPVLMMIAFLLVAVAGIQLGRSLANLAAGSGWTWPATDVGAGASSPIGSAFWTSLPAVLDGDAGAGLPTPIPHSVAGSPLLWLCLAVTEAALLTAATWASVYVYQRWGPGRMRGMATPAEAEKLLGVTRLRKVAGIVRPDLYGKHASPPEAVHHTAGDTDSTNIELGRGLSPWLLKGRLKVTGDRR